METKTSKAVQLFKSGKIKDALRIFKTFRTNVDKEEKRVMEISYEVLCGRSAFYKSMGIDTESMVACAKTIIEKKYC